MNMAYETSIEIVYASSHSLEVVQRTRDTRVYPLVLLHVAKLNEPLMWQSYNVRGGGLISFDKSLPMIDKMCCIPYDKKIFRVCIL